MILNFSYPSEILNYSQRAKGNVVAQAIGYAVGTMMTYCMPLAVANISWKYYIINGVWNIPMVAVIWWMFPETKGKTLEEIDSIFEGDTSRSWLQVIDGAEVKEESTKPKD